MISERVKILPLLILVAMLAFSVRLADVAMGVSSLSGSAMAEEKKKEEPAKKEPPKEEMKIAAKPKDSELEDPKDMEGKDDDAMPAKESAEGEETPENDWRDASDQEMEYNDVKMEMFDSLTERRKTLDSREQALMTREALLKAGEQELDRKFQELSQLRTEIMGLLKQQSEEEQARITSLVQIYEGMKPKDAARIFDTLDLDVLLAVMGQMSERKLSPILAAMNPERARTITIMLAEQKQLPQLPQQ